jgi:hypothetical protein
MRLNVHAMTIDEWVNFITKGKSPLDLLWPPDAFAVAASLLHRSGAYTSVVNGWPPCGMSQEFWAMMIRKVGDEWRANYSTAPALPPKVWEWWKNVLSRSDTLDLQDLCSARNQDICASLLQISAACDEACRDVCFEGAGTGANPFDEELDRLVTSQKGIIRSLCKVVPYDRIAVLPKCRTPELGVSIRSLTHHLALFYPGEVIPEFHEVSRIADFPLEHELNLLLVPFPLKVDSSCFRAVSEENWPASLCSGYGMFEYEIPQLDFKALHRVIVAGLAASQKIHAVVFPELSIREDQLKELVKFISERIDSAFVICGVGGVKTNQAVWAWRHSGVMHIHKQNKHHRWLLSKDQINRYHLQSKLPDLDYWEHISIGSRSLKFLSFTPWLTGCILICEDLARQDPIADAVRAVGPNLIIALLLDGPQLKHRWPARYATVLAEDPGSSVLTLTSKGMAEKSHCPPHPPSRTIGLWRDVESGVQELALENGDAMVLRLVKRVFPQSTADSRTLGGEASAWVYEGYTEINSLQVDLQLS